MTKKRIEESQLQLQLKSTLSSNSGICMVRKSGHAAIAGITCGGTEKRAPANLIEMASLRYQERKHRRGEMPEVSSATRPAKPRLLHEAPAHEPGALHAKEKACRARGNRLALWRELGAGWYTEGISQAAAHLGRGSGPTCPRSQRNRRDVSIRSGSFLGRPARNRPHSGR